MQPMGRFEHEAAEATETEPETSDAEAARGSQKDARLLPGREQQGRASTGKALAIGSAVLLVASAGAGVACLSPSSQELRSGSAGATSLQSALAKPKRDDCASSDEDCWPTGCCNVAGMTCYMVTQGKGECLKNCTPTEKRSCTQPDPITDKVLVNAEWQQPTMFCFTFAMQDTGSDSGLYHELELVQGQYQRKMGPFACEKWAAFSDQDGQLGPDARLTKVDDMDGDFHFQKRKETGTWVNAGHFHQVWRAIRDGVDYKGTNWVVKVDADAVFIPRRLAPLLHGRPVPPGGIYLENCRYVKYGWFGNLEIYSAQAFQTLLDNIDECKGSLDWQTGVEGGKYGPMGEDLFAQTCLDSLGVRRGEVFEATTDGACEEDRPYDQKKNKKWKPNCVDTNTPQYHPFMDPHDFFACYEATIAKFGPN